MSRLASAKKIQLDKQHYVIMTTFATFQIVEDRLTTK